MKIQIKNSHQLAIMQTGGHKLSEILKQLIRYTAIGKTLAEVDARAQALIAQTGGSPGFMTVNGYQWTTCINLNDGVVHGIPNQTKIQSGDVVSIDIGLLFNGLHTDMSHTFQVLPPTTHSQPPIDNEVERFLQAGKEALRKAIQVIKPGRRVGHISKAMGETIEAYGYHCVDHLTGHGIGKHLHEYPPVPCLLVGSLEDTPVLKAGMTLAVEVIYTQGEPKTYTDRVDGWTIRTRDGKIAAMFEKTIAVSGDGFVLLTP